MCVQMNLPRRILAVNSSYCTYEMTLVAGYHNSCTFSLLVKRSIESGVELFSVEEMIDEPKGNVSEFFFLFFSYQLVLLLLSIIMLLYTIIITITFIR
jgi:hypothetical protein